MVVIDVVAIAFFMLACTTFAIWLVVYPIDIITKYFTATVATMVVVIIIATFTICFTVVVTVHIVVVDILTTFSTYGIYSVATTVAYCCTVIAYIDGFFLTIVFATLVA
jgi:hypothetical protein